ncbi:Reactive Intermediate Deaminase A [Citrus sinensis]|uniref:Uncharacterized protein n=1 Tax=Citrus clementina TaxID=85681 RepID=V4USR5_CITCL|nr:hypothetical protein CICLE_v10009443mg [Citrus x clementina]KAH9651731.1 Reactive Intermediate Deaminase A [Citrus sinensis]
MAWCSLRSLNVPTIDMGALRTRSRLAAVGIGCASVAGSSVWRSSCKKHSTPFACLSTSAVSNLKEAVVTNKAPAALGPYSQAIKANNLVFVSGVLGLVPEVCYVSLLSFIGTISCRILTIYVFESPFQTGKFVSDTIEDQTEQVLKNIGEILKASGADYSSVVKTTILYEFFCPSPPQFLLFEVDG